MSSGFLNRNDKLRIIYRLSHNIIRSGSNFLLKAFDCFVQMLHIWVKCCSDYKVGFLLQRLAGEGYSFIELLNHPNDLKRGQIVYRTGSRQIPETSRIACHSQNMIYSQRIEAHHVRLRTNQVPIAAGNMNEWTKSNLSQH
ncbi:hypothetical protein D1872_230110 [compost metagenome]